MRPNPDGCAAESTESRTPQVATDTNAFEPMLAFAPTLVRSGNEIERAAVTTSICAPVEKSILVSTEIVRGEVLHSNVVEASIVAPSAGAMRAGGGEMSKLTSRVVAARRRTPSVLCIAKTVVLSL